ncbi:hypothetical protein J5X84_31605 [Streptosporangiaceae bacterium NEAU-GS5]|nr:hypothetical protein [Streptosporangiaceae bacterium NEAU-GS5]
MTHPRPESFEAGQVGWTGAEVVDTARARGVADARSGQLDEWNFDPEKLPTYLAWLSTEQERVFNAMPGNDRTRIERLQTQADLLSTDEAMADVRIARLETRHAEVAENVRNIRSRIDALARDDERRRRRRRFLETDPAEDNVGGAEAVGPEGTRWEGPFTSPPLPDRVKYAILAGLIAIDIPIQVVVFGFFHGRTQLEQVLTWIFAVSVAGIMVLLPHLAGYFYRGRHATGEERPIVLTGLVLLLPGLYLAAVLGYLRARVLLVPPTSIDENGNIVSQGLRSAAEPLHASDYSVIALFVLLLFITSGISFIIGAARHHPLRTAHENATAARDAAEAELAESRTEQAGRAERRNALEAERARLENTATDRLNEDRGTVAEAFRSAKLAYLDGAQQGLANPKASDVIAELASRL